PDPGPADKTPAPRRPAARAGSPPQRGGRPATASTDDQRHVLKLLVKDVLIGPEKITIRHRIPARASASRITQRDPQPDSEGDNRPSCQVRWGRDETAPWEPVTVRRSSSEPKSRHKAYR